MNSTIMRSLECGFSVDLGCSLLSIVGQHRCYRDCHRAPVWSSNRLIARFVEGSLPFLARNLVQNLSPIQGWARRLDVELSLGSSNAQPEPGIAQPVFCVQRSTHEDPYASVSNHVGPLPRILYNSAAVLILVSSLLQAPVAEALEEASSTDGTAAPLMDSQISKEDRQASDNFSSRVSEAVNLLEKGQLAQARGDFVAALDCFSEVTEKAGDLALAEYARVGHAVTLYEVGDRGQAITEMEDVSISLKGYPEIHAALAAALYADKNAPLPAERQFTIATLLDPRYTDLTWVQEAKHWPPSLLKSLSRFIALR